MFNKPMFWATLIFGLSLLYLVAAVIALRGDTHHWSVSTVADPARPARAGNADGVSASCAR
jgi:hypothetical protein